MKHTNPTNMGRGELYEAYQRAIETDDEERLIELQQEICERWVNGYESTVAAEGDFDRDRESLVQTIRTAYPDYRVTSHQAKGNRFKLIEFKDSDEFITGVPNAFIELIANVHHDRNDWDDWDVTIDVADLDEFTRDVSDELSTRGFSSGGPDDE